MHKLQNRVLKTVSFFMQKSRLGSYEEERIENQSHKARDLRERIGSTLEEAKMAELMKTKKELKRAKDSATQSWLDSRPLIVELERLKSSLASAQNQSTTSNIAISEIESQLESTNTCIKSKKEEALTVTKMINEISQALNQTREKLGRLKQDIDEEQHARLKLKQVLEVRNQSLWTLQLMLRAVPLETEAFGTSEAEALHLINCSEKDNTIVQLNHEDYNALTRRAKEETSLADWRLYVSMEQKLAAEASRNFALTRLKDLNSDNNLQRWAAKEEEIIEDGFTKREAEEQDPSMKVGASVNNRQNAFPKARDKLPATSNHRKPPQQFRRSRSKNNRKLIKKKKKKKPSIVT